VIVLDTNVLSEGLRPAPDRAVRQWLVEQEPLDVYTTTITQAEVFYGIESLPVGKRRSKLATAFENIFLEEFFGRILPFDEEAAREYGRIVVGRERLGRPISQPDAMIAAIARSRNATVATRDSKGFEHCGVRLINPWDE
jgi:predicted nucleic acid-binding protein